MTRGLSSPETRLVLGAIVAFALFFALGAFVSSRPPTRIDLAGGAVRGEWTGVAAFFTALGRTNPLLALGALAIVVALAARLSIVPAFALIVSQVLSQGAIAALKPAFHRMRPDHWLLYRERDFSYPSGHAATAVVFFAALGALAWRSPLPRPLVALVATAAGLCVVAIPWSRLALGAHYVTDVAGGLLFGTGWLCLAAALALRASAALP